MQTLEQTLGISAQVADIERIRRILGEEKLIMVGHSFGGFLASLYAAEFPEHVARMVGEFLDELTFPKATMIDCRQESNRSAHFRPTGWLFFQLSGRLSARAKEGE